MVNVRSRANVVWVVMTATWLSMTLCSGCTPQWQQDIDGDYYYAPNPDTVETIYNDYGLPLATGIEVYYVYLCGPASDGQYFHMLYEGEYEETHTFEENGQFLYA